MQALYVKNKDAINEIPEGTKNVILGFRPGINDLMATKQVCKTVERIYLSPSYSKLLGKSSRKAVEMLGIEVVSKKIVHGKRIDLTGNIVEIEEAPKEAQKEAPKKQAKNGKPKKNEKKPKK